MTYEAFRDPEIGDEDGGPAEARERESYLPRWIRWPLSAFVAACLSLAILPVLLMGFLAAWPLALVAIPFVLFGIGGDPRGRKAAHVEYRHRHPHLPPVWMQPHEIEP